MRINNFFLFVVFFLDMSLIGSSNENLNIDVSVEKVREILESSIKTNEEKIKKLVDSVYREDYKIKEKQEENGVAQFLLKHTIFDKIKKAGFSINLNKNHTKPYWGSFFFVPSLKKEDLHLEDLMQLIPPTLFEGSDEYYNIFASYFFGKIALDRSLRNEIPHFVHAVEQADRGEYKLKNLVLFFLKAQILEYKPLAIKKYDLEYRKKSTVIDKQWPRSSFMSLMREFMNDLISSSSPAFISAQRLYKIKPDLFNDKIDGLEGSKYRKEIKNFCDLIIPNVGDALKTQGSVGNPRSGWPSFDSDFADAYYEVFLKAVKENKAQYLWRNYSGYVFGGGSIIGLLLILAKKYQLNSKFQEFLEKYRSK